MTPQPPFHAPHGALFNLCEACRLPKLPQDPAGAQHCSRPVCVTKRRMHDATQKAKAARAKRNAEFDATLRRAELAIDLAKQSLGLRDTQTVASGVAPYIAPPIEPLSEARIAEFSAHLHKVIAESFEQHSEEDGPVSPPKKDPEYAQRLAEEAPELKPLDTACIACQGDCCLQGRKTHAFLSTRTIDYIRWSKPEMTAEEIAEMYLSQLPDRSALESCVFHGEKGCVLGREIRADICNSFQCGFRKRLAKAYETHPGQGAVVAGMARDHQDHPELGAPYMRLVSMTEAGDVTIHDDIPMPALPSDEAGG